MQAQSLTEAEKKAFQNAYKASGKEKRAAMDQMTIDTIRQLVNLPSGERPQWWANYWKAQEGASQAPTMQNAQDTMEPEAIDAELTSQTMGGNLPPTSSYAQAQIQGQPLDQPQQSGRLPGPGGQSQGPVFNDEGVWSYKAWQPTGDEMVIGAKMRGQRNWTQMPTKEAIAKSVSISNLRGTDPMVVYAVRQCNALMAKMNVVSTRRMFPKGTTEKLMAYVTDQMVVAAGAGPTRLYFQLVNGYVYTNLAVIDPAKDGMVMRRVMLLLGKRNAHEIKTQLGAAKSMQGVFAQRLVTVLQKYNAFAKAVNSLAKLYNKFPDIMTEAHADVWQSLQADKEKMKPKRLLARANKILFQQTGKKLGQDGYGLGKLKLAMDAQQLASQAAIDNFAQGAKAAQVSSHTALLQGLQNYGGAYDFRQKVKPTNLRAPVKTDFATWGSA